MEKDLVDAQGTLISLYTKLTEVKNTLKSEKDSFSKEVEAYKKHFAGLHEEFDDVFKLTY